MDRRASRIALQENLSGHKHVNTLTVLLETITDSEAADNAEAARLLQNHRPNLNKEHLLGYRQVYH